ncbi:hypothetical protein A1O7_03887 [Cladophialophora yegresii CBS 114405]|uniref:C2H2-type domain-containing protein n=1 Tax=Cladophialophora yegresii CBS 114405 TaxID=1182544 RepID=W9W404_9EURO|nr:uncharacterized protein A1O7_03887 [Cladophialophora yegresii CBS 114405]EXJ59740.1 hypothetical protein A1O7_03887 [Cladophialophora yegresii CBS 114405]
MTHHCGKSHFESFTRVDEESHTGRQHSIAVEDKDEDEDEEVQEHKQPTAWTWAWLYVRVLSLPSLAWMACMLGLPVRRPARSDVIEALPMQCKSAGSGPKGELEPSERTGAPATATTELLPPLEWSTRAKSHSQSILAHGDRPKDRRKSEAVPLPEHGEDVSLRHRELADLKVAREWTHTSVATGIFEESSNPTTAIPAQNLDTTLDPEIATKRDVAQEWWREQAAIAGVVPIPESQDTEQDSIKCNECSRVFATESGLTRHMSVLHRRLPRLWNCKKCLSAFRTETGRDRHLNVVHADEVVDGDPEGIPQYSKWSPEPRMMQLELTTQRDGRVIFEPWRSKRDAVDL